MEPDELYGGWRRSRPAVAGDLLRDREIRGLRVAQLKNTTPQHEAGLWIDYREKVNQSRVFYDSDSILLYNRSRNYREG